MKSLVLLVICLFLGACSTTLDSRQCESGNWEHIGLIDGLKGRTKDYIKKHRQSCGDAQVSEERYLEGRARGLKDFCTPAGGYEAGVSGRTYFGVCEGEAENPFKEQYALGRKVYLLKQRNAQVQKDIEEKQKEIDGDESVLNHVVQGFNLLGGVSPTASLDRRKEAIEKEIYEIESSQPVGLSQNHHAVKTSNTRMAINSLGALAGTFTGFGVGHAIQGRYRQTGWKWTAGDIAWIGVMSASHNEFCRTQIQVDGQSRSECDNALPGLTVLGFLGLRIWQTVDLWSNLSGNEYRASYQLILKPGGLGIAGTF